MNQKRFSLFLVVFISLFSLNLSPRLAFSSTTAPEKFEPSVPTKIDIPFILKLGAAHSSQFKSILIQDEANASIPLLSEAAYDTKFYSSLNYLNDKREPSSPLLPNSQSRIGGQVGVQKYFSSGTALQFELNQNKNKATLTPSPLSPLSESQFYETQWNLFLNQSLWSNQFGEVTRIEAEKSQKLLKMQKLLNDEEKEEWAIGLIQTFYGAWISQQQLITQLSNLETKKKLLNILRMKLNRGTAEKPDFLQIESAELQAQNQLKSAENSLSETWSALVIALGLPEEWKQLNPAKLPLYLDPVALEVNNYCRTDLTQKRTKDARQVQISSLYQETADLKLNQIKSKTAPDLKLSAGILGNSLDPSLNTSLTDTAQLSHLGYQVGLRLELSIDQSTEKAQRIQAYADSEKSKLQNILAKDRYQIQNESFCSQLSVLQANYENARKMVDKQAERAKLEESRFNIGRTGVFSVIQASDDLVMAKFNLSLLEIERRKLVWKILRNNGQIVSYLKTL